MKKFFALFLSLMMLFACSAVAETVDMSAPTFVVGEDTAEYEVEGASGYNVVNAFVKIAAGEDVLFNGVVTLTSDTLSVAEATLAAIYELGCGQEGLEAGFVTSMGDYVAGTDADGNYVYWSNTINGKYVPLNCADFRLLDGDYVQWDFVTYIAE